MCNIRLSMDQWAIDLAAIVGVVFAKMQEMRQTKRTWMSQWTGSNIHVGALIVSKFTHSL